jgi:hypothetical protein
MTKIIALLVLSCVCHAADPDFTIVAVPDPQYLQFCTSVYNGIFSWIVANRTLSVGGTPLNIKAVIGMGDLEHTGGNEASASTAWGALDTAGIPFLSPAGNHDINDGGSMPPPRTVRTHFQLGGFFAGDVRATKAQYNAALPGGGGTATWGGYYDSGGSLNYDAQNMYFKMTVGVRKLLIAVLEFYPRSGVLVWLKGIHDANPGYEVLVVTHSYLTDTAAQVTRDTAISGAGPCSGTTANSYGPDSYSMGPAPGSNSGCEMWNGSDATWVGMKSWTNLTLVINGHELVAGSHLEGPDASFYTLLQPITSVSTKAQTVQQIFTNFQDLDQPTPCTGGVGDPTKNAAHITLLKFRPAINKLEVYSLSTLSGNWVAAGPTLSYSGTPVALYNVNYPGVGPVIPASTSMGSVTMRGGVVR